MFRKISWIKKIFSGNLKCIYCIGSVLGTGAGFTTFVFFIGTTIKNNLDDDPHNNQVFVWDEKWKGKVRRREIVEENMSFSEWLLFPIFHKISNKIIKLI